MSVQKVARQAGGRNGTKVFNVEDTDGYDYTVLAGADGFVGCLAHGETCDHAIAVKEKLAKKK